MEANVRHVGMWNETEFRIGVVESGDEAIFCGLGSQSWLFV